MLQQQMRLTSLQRQEVIQSMSASFLEVVRMVSCQYPSMDAEEFIPLLNGASAEAHRILLRTAEIEARLDNVGPK